MILQTDRLTACHTVAVEPFAGLRQEAVSSDLVSGAFVMDTITQFEFILFIYFFAFTVVVWSVSSTEPKNGCFWVDSDQAAASESLLFPSCLWIFLLLLLFPFTCVQ